ncbi:MAG: branched-chain amino acid ABC transporter permease LivH [SAR324 cluster bacterium]|uniref:Branched-chain amino acid ABC transporter permease LivH n=1 Tax=SAR324 cluster bacterium TaxID=2024889 RepID=A0A2A4SV13_9DELT|nr:MAG: branched-chain amino acid ABC transporter permease LivH [SAR324 cluster bacterium]
MQALNESGSFFLELFFSGLTRGSIYALIALGYTMVYGIIGLINFAHGEIYMIGAFVGLTVAGILSILQFNLIAILVLAALFAMVYAAAYGYTIEKVAYKPLRGSTRLAPLISAIGMSMFLREYVILAQTPDFVSFPALTEGLFDLGAFSSMIQPTELVILIFSFLMMAGLFILIKKTKIGKAMRAISQDREMAMLLGVNSDRMISLTFMIGSALAAFGAILISAHVGQINYNIGFVVGIKAFTAAVLGGIGSIPGAALGGIILGLTESFATGYVSSDYEDVFAFGILVLILIFKPAGILGKSTTEKV